jgi:GTP cyclohydrolase I
VGKAEDLFAAWLDELGFRGDPEMADTARRFTEMFAEFVPGDDSRLADGFTLVGATDAPNAVVLPIAIREMPFHSFCAHHLVPFFGRAHVAYLPGRHLAGFGSIARVVQHFAKRPQLQERLAEQVADTLWSILQPRSVIVRLEARQMCMEMRGAKVHGEVEVLAMRGEDLAVLREMVR